MEEPTPCHEVLVVVVVKPVRGPVEGSKVGVLSRGRAVSPSGGSEAGVDVGLIVDAVPEGGTPGQANSMAPRQGGHVTGIEALGSEGGDEGGKAGERRWDLAVGTAQASGPCISPP